MALERNLEKIHTRFFEEMRINPGTGRLDGSPGKKFATYPYIGSKYGHAGKILFVGQDIGKDPQPGRIQSFSERRVSIEDKHPSLHNPHIAGTYMTALYFLKDGLGWRYHWEKIAKTGATCQMTLQHREDLLPPENPLSYCALTNYHKFVTECRQHRSGRMDRNYLYREAERKFFMDVELEAFDPDVVVFQGAGFERKMANLRRAGTRIYVGQHPSARGEGIRKPKVLIEDMLGRL